MVLLRRLGGKKVPTEQHRAREFTRASREVHAFLPSILLLSLVVRTRYDVVRAECRTAGEVLLGCGDPTPRGYILFSLWWARGKKKRVVSSSYRKTSPSKYKIRSR